MQYSQLFQKTVQKRKNQGISSKDRNLLLAISLGLSAGIAITYLTLRKFLFSPEKEGAQLTDFVKRNQNNVQEEQEGEQQIQAKQFVPRPIVNFGNTCFVNSILQALAAIPTFVRELKKALPDTVYRDELSVLTAYELYSVLESLNVAADGYTRVQSLEPHRLIKLFEKNSNYLSFFDQQDAHELLKLAISCYEGAIKAQHSRKTIQMHSLTSLWRKETQTLAENCLAGLSKSYLLCTQCDAQESIRLENFFDLSLDLLRSQSISQAIKSLYSRELIEGVVCFNCSVKTLVRQKRSSLETARKQILAEDRPWKTAAHCLEEQLATLERLVATHQVERDLEAMIEQFQNLQREQLKRHQIENSEIRNMISAPLRKIKRQTVKVNEIVKAPRVAIFHLKRLVADVYGDLQKVQNQLQFDEYLSLDERFGLLPENSKNYRLAAVVVHLGQSGHGHYITLRRTPCTCQSQADNSQEFSQSDSYQSLGTSQNTQKNCCSVPTKWYYASDETINTIEQNQVFSAQAYLLFYESYTEKIKAIESEFSHNNSEGSFEPLSCSFEALSL